jgi:hypothetical protein
MGISEKMATASRADGSGMVVSCTLSIRTPPVSAVVELLSKPYRRNSTVVSP